jgi:hypothetical protein
MNTTRTGKIARLPFNIRRDLNVHLDNNQPGPAILEWLNSLPETKEVLDGFFDGRPISEQNLSEWRKGGYEDWLRLEEARRIASAMREEGEQLDCAMGQDALSERLSTLLSVELAVRAKARLAEAANEDERWKRLVEIMRELDRLRRSDQRAARLRIDRAQAEFDLECQCEDHHRDQVARSREESHDRISAMMAYQKLAGQMGGSPEARRKAAFHTELEWNLALGTLAKMERDLEARRKNRASAQQPAEAQSEPAPTDHPQPSQTMHYPLPTQNLHPTPPDASQNPANPAKSKQIKPFKSSGRTAAVPGRSNNPQPLDTRKPVNPEPQPSPQEPAQNPSNPTKSKTPPKAKPEEDMTVAELMQNATHGNRALKATRNRLELVSLTNEFTPIGLHDGKVTPKIVRHFLDHLRAGLL